MSDDTPFKVLNLMRDPDTIPPRKRTPITATPYAWKDAHLIPPREHGFQFVECPPTEKLVEYPNEIDVRSLTGEKQYAPPYIECRGEPLAAVLWAGRQWAVTEYGVEARDGCYVIEKKRLWEDETRWGWLRHMSEKEWVDMVDFSAALTIARLKFSRSKPRRGQQ